MNIIILSEKDQIEKNIYQINDDRLLHIKNILKSEANDIIEIGLLNGPIGKAKIIEITEVQVRLKIVKLNETNNLEPRIDIICALPRPQSLKKVLTTSATMGVQNLYLIRSGKVEKSYFHSRLLEKENYTKYLIEGLSQGKRTQLPSISVHNRFKQFFEDNFPTEYNKPTKLLAHTDEDVYLNKLQVEKKEHYVIAIGPEGGWNNFEIEFMVKNGFREFKLSKNILRVETAVTAALAQLELLNA